MLLIKSIVAIATLCVFSACSSAPKPPPRLSEDLQKSVGTVGVITIGPVVGGKVEGPIGVGNQAVVGVIEGGAIGVGAGVTSGALLGLLCGPGAFICSPVGAIGGGVLGLGGGGIYGGVKKGQNAIPQSAAAEIQTALTAAIADHDLQADLRQRVLQQGGSKTMPTDLGTGPIMPVATTDYASFTGRAIGTVLETSLTQLAFTSEGGKNPTLALVITARARLIRIADKRVLWNVAEVRYESPAAGFSFWATSDSSLMKMEIDKGLESLSHQIGEALSLRPVLQRGQQFVAHL